MLPWLLVGNSTVLSYVLSRKDLAVFFSSQMLDWDCYGCSPKVDAIWTGVSRAASDGSLWHLRPLGEADACSDEVSRHQDGSLSVTLVSSDRLIRLEVNFVVNVNLRSLSTF